MQTGEEMPSVIVNRDEQKHDLNKQKRRIQMGKQIKQKFMAMVLTLAMVSGFLPAMTLSASAFTDMGVTGVVITNMDVSAYPTTTTTIKVTMTEIGLSTNDFAIANTTTPTATASVTNASYNTDSYILTVSGMTYYDDYTLTISKTGFDTYTNSTFYGTLVTSSDIDIAPDHEKNIFDAYTRTLNSDGILTIGCSTYAADATLHSGTDYAQIDSNNGNPDNGTNTRVIGYLLKAPTIGGTAAKGAKTLLTNGSMSAVSADYLIDGNTNYAETVQSARNYNTDHASDPGFTPNTYVDTVYAAALYTTIATARQADMSRILKDPADRFRIIAWYDNEACTGTPIKVVRLMVQVNYTGAAISASDTPTVTAISPNSGSTAGGTSVTISGTNFGGTSAVTIGGVAATSVTLSSPTTLTATTPTGTLGAADVVVTAPGGTGTGTGLFTYTPASDYTINTVDHDWTDSSAITLANDGDSLQLLSSASPLTGVKIHVTAPDGSVVTIRGSETTYSNVRIDVDNDITLKIDNLSITSFENYPALQFNKADTGPEGVTLQVSGTCNLTGSGWGSGILSETDQSLTIKGSGGVLNATGSCSDSGGDGICMTGMAPADPMGAGAKLLIEGGVTVNATGANAGIYSGGSGILVAWGNLEINGATVTAKNGTSQSNSAGNAIWVSVPEYHHEYGGNLTIVNSTVTAIGGSNSSMSGGNAIYADNNISITGSDVKATGGNSESANGGIAIFAVEKDLTISGGTVTATGGNGYAYGGHAIYCKKGTTTVETGANLSVVGGNGTTQGGGVGLRAAGNDGTTLFGNTVTITNGAGDVYIRGGQGATTQRASIMGKDVYIATGNIGTVLMESGAGARTIKNSVGGDDIYLVNATTSPVAAVTIQSSVSGALGGNYTYRSVAKSDGTACLWLPSGSQTLFATGYTSEVKTVAEEDTQNTVTIKSPSVVTAHNSSELVAYIASPNVSTINLVSGTTYDYDGASTTRSLTINGNGATINVGTGIDGVIVKMTSGAVPNATGKVFFEIGTGGSLTMNHVTLHDASTMILAAYNVKTGGTLSLDGVVFDGFFANTSTVADTASANTCTNNFGVHAEPGATSTTVTNCTFGSSNAFRNAVSIRGGTAAITNNTFVGAGSSVASRLNHSDGNEYAVYLYGGNSTVTGNTMSGYDNRFLLNYLTSAISTAPYYDLTATIIGNTIHDNMCGINIVGAWHTLSSPAVATINGAALTSSANAFTQGQALTAQNTLSSNAQGGVQLNLDQNDYYVDNGNSKEYGTPVYCGDFLWLASQTSTSATLSFSTCDSVLSYIANQKSFIIQVSEDNGATWKAATTLAALGTGSTDATITLASGKTYLLRAVLTISSVVRAAGSDETPIVYDDLLCYTNTVSATITAASYGGTTTGTTGGASVIVNGEAKTAGTSNTTTGTNGQTTTTVTVDTDKLKALLESEGSGATVIIPVTGGSDVAAGVLTGKMVKSMESQKATLVIQTDSATYTLPASEIDIDAVSAQLGTKLSLSDITVKVEIAEPSADTVSVVKNAAEDGEFSIVVPAVNFTINCTYNGQMVDVSSFNAYVERMIAIPDGVNPAKITTGVVVKPDGKTYHVPTQVVKISGKYYAKINSLTNSTYTVIWHPIEFADVAGHWAKGAINDMGSRMVVNGDTSGNYNPNNDITRAEFAAIVVRALGLAPGVGENSFGDVASSAWYCGYVETATYYGIIKGYGSGNFGPSDTITREQAMTMLARAMKLTGLDVSLTDGDVSALLEAYTDGASASAYAEDSIALCLKSGITSGTSSTTISPKEYITRAEVAVMVQRLLQKSTLI